MVLSTILRFFKPKPLTIIIAGIYLTIAAIGHYESSISYQFGEEYYYQRWFYLWFWLTYPLLPLQLWLLASLPSFLELMWLTTIVYSYVMSCILAYAARRARGGLKTHYNI